MRFKKGSKVEIMNKEVPASWRVAEILSGNGHAYNVKYDAYPGIEKVSRRFIRPSPPSIGSQSWTAGDIVEVFDKNSWKIATISKVLKENRYSVRPHGFTDEIVVYKTIIRVRQTWREGQWIPIGKISGSYGDLKIRNSLEQNYSLKICQEEEAKLQESYVISKTLKRSSPFCSSILEANHVKVKKVKRDEKDQSQRRISGQTFEKVDAFAYPRDTLGGNKYNSFNGYYETEKRKKEKGVGFNLERISEPNESDNDECSVGSCSVGSDNRNNNYHNNRNNYDAVTCDSDGESFNISRQKEKEEKVEMNINIDIDIDIHKLELHAYRSTLEALYASGPLSWEKEALLTNLRINLHISNDEHLTELRNLISSGAGILD